MIKKAIFLLVLMLSYKYTILAFEKLPSFDDNRIEKVLALPEISLNSDTMIYTGINMPYYQMANIAVYDSETMKELTLPKPQKSYFYPVLLSDNVMIYLNQLESICDEMDRVDIADKPEYIMKIAELLAAAEKNVTIDDMSVIRGFDQIDYAFADMMYNIELLTDLNTKKEIVYNIADILHESNLQTKIRLSKSGNYNTGLLEKQLGYYLCYYGAAYEEQGFIDTFKYHASSQMFVPENDNSISLDETIYSINNIFKANETEREKVKQMLETPNSSILEESTLTQEQISQMQEELNRQGTINDASIEYVLDNGICYQYRYSIINGEKVLDKKRKLKPEEQYYCSSGLDGTVNMPGGEDSIKIHQASKTQDVKSKIMDTTKARQLLKELKGNILVYQYKNQTVETNILIEEDETLNFDEVRKMIKWFADENDFIIFDDEDKFLLFADNALYNFYTIKDAVDISYNDLNKITKGLLLLSKKEKSPLIYESAALEGITNLDAIGFNNRTTYLTESMILQKDCLYVPIEDFIKIMRVEYSELANGYLLHDTALKTSAIVDTSNFTITTVDNSFNISALVFTGENNQKYIDIIAVNKLLGRKIAVQDGKIIIYNAK